MKIWKNNTAGVSLDLSEEELRLILGALREIGQVVDDFEFYARVGGKKSEVNDLCVKLKTLMEAASIAI